MSDQSLSDDTKQFDRWYLQNVVKKFNPDIDEDYYIMQLQHQQTFTHLYFGQGKKRYYAIKPNGQKYIKGINIIRKDCPLFMRSKLNELAQLAVRQQLMVHHLEQVRKIIQQIPYRQMGVYKRFTKQFEQYVKKDQHVYAAQYANSKYGTSITKDDVPLLFNIIVLDQDQLKRKDRNKAICLLQEDLHIIDQNKDKFVIDYDTYFDKQCIHPLQQFGYIDSVVWVLQNYKKQNRHFYPFKASMNCPACGKKHSKVEPARKCVTKVVDKIRKKKQQQITQQQKQMLAKIPEFLKHYQE